MSIYETAPSKDRVGRGRYLLSFLLLGPVGLGIAFLMRDRGWTPIMISGAVVIPIYTAILFFFLLIVVSGDMSWFGAGS